MDLPRVGKIDMLTRTTLQLHDAMSPPSIAHLIFALQRVPGVLLADLDLGATSVVVAHDSAVSTATLVTAATAAGSRVTLVARPPVAPNVDAEAPSSKKINFITMGAVVLGPALLLLTIELVDPPLATNHFFLPIFLSIAWTTVFIRPMFRRQR
jgi:hypothetical protein